MLNQNFPDFLMAPTRFSEKEQESLKLPSTKSSLPTRPNLRCWWTSLLVLVLVRRSPMRMRKKRSQSLAALIRIRWLWALTMGLGMGGLMEIVVGWSFRILRPQVSTICSLCGIWRVQDDRRGTTSSLSKSETTFSSLLIGTYNEVGEKNGDWEGVGFLLGDMPCSGGWARKMEKARKWRKWGGNRGIRKGKIFGLPFIHPRASNSLFFNWILILTGCSIRTSFQCDHNR